MQDKFTIPQIVAFLTTLVTILAGVGLVKLNTFATVDTVKALECRLINAERRNHRRDKSESIVKLKLYLTDPHIVADTQRDLEDIGSRINDSDHEYRTHCK